MSAEVIVLTILMFFLLVGIHEWGHFFFAKRSGILVREFAIGFGPKVFSYKKGETRYTFRLLPIGGFVRMAGEDPEVVKINVGQRIAVAFQGEKALKLFVDRLDERQETLHGVVERIDLEHTLQMELDVDGDRQAIPIHDQAVIVHRGMETQIAPANRQFGNKTVGQRAMTIFAGPMMNFVLAFVLFLVVAFLTGIPTGEDATYTKISMVEAGAPAAQAGVETGDIINKVNGQSIGANSGKLIELIEKSANKPMDWLLSRDGEDIAVKVTPDGSTGVGKVGIGIVSPLPTKTPNVIQAVDQASTSMWLSTKNIMSGLKKLVTLQVKMDDLGGPVRITEFTGEAITMGFDIYIYWAAILSLYLGIFNLLPFPALDGSRLLFIGLEGVRGKPIDPTRESMVHFVGFALLMLLMVAVTYNDIVRLFRG